MCLGGDTAGDVEWVVGKGVKNDFDDMKIETFNTLSISELHPKVARAYSNLDIADVFNKNYNIRISKLKTFIEKSDNIYVFSYRYNKIYRKMFNN